VHERSRARLAIVAVVLGASMLVTAAWSMRRAIACMVGRAVVAEDPVARADLVVLSNADVRSAAFEAAALYRAGNAARIGLLPWERDPLDERIRSMGVTYPTYTELAAQIMQREGVPSTALVVLPAAVDGTGAEARAVAAYVHDAGIASVTYVTARSHTARARRLLRREIGPDVHVSVRAARDDPFRADGWWCRRATARELALEYVRWAVEWPSVR
jgi:uncharacterized SAM-binding protein YcdF (DUF218 family)